jgi:hypothetical protein
MHGCKLSTSKSTRIVEESILSYVRAKVLTPQRIEDVVKRANDFLAVEAAKPRVDALPFERAIADLKRKRERLIDLVAESVSPDLTAIRTRITQFEKQLRELTQQLRQAQSANAAPVSPVDLEQTLPLLADIRGLLNQDVVIAGPVLRRLLGKVWVKRAEGQDAPPKAWTATFRANVVPLIAEAKARERDCPDSLSWLNLKKRIWTAFPEETLIAADADPVYQSWSSQVAALVDGGMTITQAARELGLNYAQTSYGYRFSKDGVHRRERLRLRRQNMAIELRK